LIQQLRENSIATGYSAIFGQQKAKDFMSRCLQSGRMSHAMIFRGPDGVGKQLFGRGLAAVVNCRDRQGERSCGVCPSCRKYLSGNHPDFTILRPEKGAIKIDRIRELCKSLAYPPYESAMRVVLLEDVHTMRQEAANALLKTLEEPPENNLLILTADSSQEVLSTILSRCQSVPFYPLSLAEAAQVIKLYADELAEGEAEVLARLAEGSPGKALALKHAGLPALLDKVVDLLCDPAGRQPDKVTKVLLLADDMASLKEDLIHFLSLLRLWLRDALFEFYGIEDDSEESRVRVGKAKRPPKDWSSEELFAKLQAIDRAEKELSRNCNRSLVCEVLLFALQNEWVKDPSNIEM